MSLHHQSAVFQTTLSPKEIAVRINQLFTESYGLNEPKYGGYTDKDYFIVRDN